MKTLRDMTEKELRELLNGCGSSLLGLCELLGVEKPMFALLLFNDPEIAQYVCNCDRSDVIEAMRETAKRLEGRDTLERVEFPGGLGATNDFPEGKLHDGDEGGLNFAVGSDKKTGKVLITFDKPVAWLGMSKSDALQMADTLRWHASKIGE